MKKSFLFSLIAVGMILLSSCKDKLNLIGDAKESAVVIGILDKANTTHYVKITRSFIGDGVTSAVDIAKISDSSYFQNIAVKVEELVNGSVTRTFNLADTMINEKNTNGVFYAPDQKVYVFYTPEANPLRSDATYRLKATIDDGRMVITGETKIVDGITPGSWSAPNSAFKFTSSGNTLGEYANQSLAYSSVGTAYKLNCKTHFEYIEYSTGLADSTIGSIAFDLGEYSTTPSPSSSQNFVWNGNALYQTIKDKIPVSNAIEKRVFYRLKIVATGASRELANYIEINKPSTSLAQNKPSFTNLKITEGYSVIGIFASRQTVVTYKNAIGPTSFVQAFDKKSRRELCVGPITGTLSFCSNHTGDGTETWACN